MGGVKHWQALLGLLLGGALASGVASSAAYFVSRRLGVAPEEAMHTLPVFASALLATSGSLIVVAVTVPLVARRPLPDALGLRVVPPGSVFVWGAIGLMGLGPIGDLLMSAVADRVPHDQVQGFEALRELGRNHSRYLLWPLVALLPGISEELFFRGMLQRAFGRGLLAIVLSAVLFSAFHLDPIHVAGVLPLGFFLAWVVARTDSTWVAIFAHVMNNTGALFALTSPELDAGYGSERPMPMAWVAFGAALTLLAVWFIDRRMRGIEEGTSSLSPRS